MSSELHDDLAYLLNCVAEIVVSWINRPAQSAPGREDVHLDFVVARFPIDGLLNLMLCTSAGINGIGSPDALLDGCVDVVESDPGLYG